MHGLKGLIKILFEQFMIFMGYVEVKKRDFNNTSNTSVVFHRNLLALQEGGLP